MVCARNSHALVHGCGALRSRGYPMRKERKMAPLSSGVILITLFRSSGVTGICQGVPVTCQVTCHTLNRLGDSRSYSHSHVMLKRSSRVLCSCVHNTGCQQRHFHSSTKLKNSSSNARIANMCNNERARSSSSNTRVDCRDKTSSSGSFDFPLSEGTDMLAQ